MIALIKKILFHDKWNIGIVNCSVQDVINGQDISAKNITWLPEIYGRYSADPFLFEQGDKLWLFFEDFSYKTNTAQLAVTEVILGEEVSFGDTHNILDSSVHRSYPYVFSVNEDVFLVPEQCETGEVVLYEAESFPLKWKKKKTLLNNFAGVDATPFFHEGQWWMFVSELGDYENEELHLYFTQDITGIWVGHPQNPIVKNAQGARMAGNIYKDKHTQKIYRKGQDCTHTYGGGLVMYHIETLTQKEYKEIQIQYIAPPKKYKQGIHTISHCDGKQLIAVDAKRWASLGEVIIKLFVVLKERIKK